VTADLEPAAISAKLARFAREALGEAIESGDASAAYTRFVNGVEGAAEESVQARRRHPLHLPVSLRDRRRGEGHGDRGLARGQRPATSAAGS
jgi:hypothetical protein